jgi:hypothetical protein
MNQRELESTVGRKTGARKKERKKERDKMRMEESKR